MAALYQVQVVLSKEMGNKHGKDVSPDLLSASVYGQLKSAIGRDIFFPCQGTNHENDNATDGATKIHLQTGRTCIARANKKGGSRLASSLHWKGKL